MGCTKHFWVGGGGLLPLFNGQLIYLHDLLKLFEILIMIGEARKLNFELWVIACGIKRLLQICKQLERALVERRGPSVSMLNWLAAF